MFKCLAGVLAVVTLAGPWLPDGAGNPGCVLKVRYLFGGLFAECVNSDCANPCTDNLTALPGYGGSVTYCPCGNWDAESSTLRCLAYIEYPEWPSSNGEFYDRNSLCVSGCEKTDPSSVGLSLVAACSRCP